MKYIASASVFFIGIALTHSAFADRWVAPVNGTVSAIMMPDSSVMLKFQLPDKEFKVIDRDMKNNDNICTIKEVYQYAKDSMILVCGPAK